MATPIISVTSLTVAPRMTAPRAWAEIQPSHSRVMAMASAMSSFVLADNVPSAMAAVWRAR
jgi:hypothetical protein